MAQFAWPIQQSVNSSRFINRWSLMLCVLTCECLLFFSAGLAHWHPTDPHSIVMAAGPWRSYPQLCPPVECHRLSPGHSSRWCCHTAGTQLEVSHQMAVSVHTHLEGFFILFSLITWPCVLVIHSFTVYLVCHLLIWILTVCVLTSGFPHYGCSVTVTGAQLKPRLRRGRRWKPGVEKTETGWYSCAVCHFWVIKSVQLFTIQNMKQK